MEVVDILKVAFPEVVEIKPEDIESDSEHPPEQTQQFPLKSPIPKVASKEPNCSTSNYVRENIGDEGIKEEFQYEHPPEQTQQFPLKSPIPTVASKEPNSSTSNYIRENIVDEGVREEFQYVCNTINEDVSVSDVPKNGSKENIETGKPNCDIQQTSNGAKIQTILMFEPPTELTVNGNILKVRSILSYVDHSKKNNGENRSYVDTEMSNMNNTKTNVNPTNQFQKEGEEIKIDPNKYLTDRMIHDEEIVLKATGYGCVYCPYSSKILRQVKQHIGWHREPEPPKRRKPKQCPHCPKKLVQLGLHIRISHTEPTNDEWVYCGHCNYKSRQKQVLRSHIKARHIEMTPDEFPICEECGKSFKFEKHLKRHKAEAHNAKRHRCDFCNFTTVRPWKLRQHMFVHKEPEEGFTCKQCDFHAPNLKEFRLHKKKVHVHWKQCHICPFKTPAFNTLKKHLIHHQEKKKEEDLTVRCKKCDYKTYRSYNLKIHMLKHQKPEEMEMFQCYHCNFKANRKDNLKTHIFKHGFYKDILSCFICSFKTSSNYELKKHIDMHSENQRKEAEKISELNKPDTKKRKANKSKANKNGNKGQRKRFEVNEEKLHAGEDIVMKIEEKENKKKMDDSDFVDNRENEIELNKPGTKKRKADNSKDNKNKNKGQRRRFELNEEKMYAGEDIVMKIKEKENKKKMDGDSDFVDNRENEIELNKPSTRKRKADKSKGNKNGNKGQKKQFKVNEEKIYAGEDIVMKTEEKENKIMDGDSDLVNNRENEIKKQN